MSAVSGFVDTSGFILLQGVFTSHVTGNLVLAGAALAGTLTGGVGVRLALLLVFVAAVAATSSIARWIDGRVGSTVAWLLGFEALWLVVYLGVGLLFGRGAEPMAEGPLFVVASTAVIAMGIQNALMREQLKTFLPTTMMTGNTTQFTLDLVAQLRGLGTPAIRTSLRRTSIVLSGFLFGAASGAIAAAQLGMWSPAPVIAVVAGIALVAGRARPARG
ncbi:DUF1275 domain-containing protein [Myxococcota bacterium]|nr:DUF1275 domain-containing protein [Myxococcota bacterium]